MYILPRTRHTNTRERQVREMEQARRRIRICLFCVVMLAVIVGVIYYLYDRNAGQIASDGTLVTAVRIAGF